MITSEDLRAQTAALRDEIAATKEPDVIDLGIIRRGPIHGITAAWVRPEVGGSYLRLVNHRVRTDGMPVDRELRFWISHLQALAHVVAQALAQAQAEAR